MTYQREALGIDFGQIARAGLSVAEDPCLQPVTRVLLKLHELEQDKAPPSQRKAVRGIGLCHAVKPLETFYKLRRRPVASSMGAVAAVAAVFAIGYAFGRKK